MKKGTLAIISNIAGVATGAAVSNSVQKKKLAELTGKVDKFRGYYNVLNQWLAVKQEGKTFDSYFEANNVKTIAIYGMGELGNRLYDELKNSNTEVKYAIDQNANCAYAEIPVCDLEQELPEVDMIVVTAIFAFDSIKETLEGHTDIQVVSLEDIVYEL